jgi:hypothetical protein
MDAEAYAMVWVRSHHGNLKQLLSLISDSNYFSNIVVGYF